MKKRLVWAVIIAVMLTLLTRYSVSVYAQYGGEASPRGLFGDVLDMVRLHGLVENMYMFRDRVFSKGGLDSELLNWLIPHYISFSKTILESPIWPLKLFFLPASIIISFCLPLYSQAGLVGVVLASGLLTGLVYALPLFLIIETFSKIGLVAMHGRIMLKILLILLLVSAVVLLVAYGHPNPPLLFSAYLLLTATLWFASFLPIVIYYKR